MVLKSNFLILTTLIFSSFIISCGAIIDTSDISCTKMSSSSTVPINELLKSPEVVNIDNKKFKLYTILRQYTGIPTVKTLFPKFASYCNLGASGSLRIDEKPLYLTVDKFERIWFINKDNQVFETDKITFENINSQERFVSDAGFKWLGNSVKIILKFTHNGNTYFIKQNRG